MSLFSELKRRNVFRVAVAYIVASWLVLQVVDVVQPILKFPDWVAQLTLLLLVLGFIAALIVSWAYEITPEGIKRDREVSPEDSIAHHTARRLDTITIVLVVVAIAVVVADRLLPEKVEVVPSAQPTQQAETEARPDVPGAESRGPSSAPQPPSVAVLPFANMSTDAENEFFADGISEELLNLLVRVEGLRVPSRTSSFAFKGQNMDIREIARQLEVNHILEGSVRKAENRVRITAQLIDVGTDTHLWSETYDRELEDIFAIQDEIAGHIVEAMHLVLGTGVTDQKPTDNLEAYTLYLQGRELFWRRSVPEDLAQASELLHRAVSLDPGFAEAWGLNALVEITMPAYSKEDNAPYAESAMEMVNQAFALDPNQLDAMLAVSQVHSVRGELGDALDQFQTMVKLAPHHSLTRQWFAVVLLKSGYLEEAFSHITRAVELDPANAINLDWYARIALTTGQLDRVVETAERSIQLGRVQGRVPLVYYYLDHGTLADIDPWLGDDDSDWAGFRKVFSVRDNPGHLEQAIEWINRNQVGGGAAYMILTAYMLSDDTEAFFRQLDQIYGYDETIDYLLWSPGLQHLRASEPFDHWARARGYDALWRSRGAPDLCQPDGADGWVCE